MENHEVLFNVKEIKIHIYEIECLPLSRVHNLLMYHLTKNIINLNNNIVILEEYLFLYLRTPPKAFHD